MGYKMDLRSFETPVITILPTISSVVVFGGLFGSSLGGSSIISSGSMGVVSGRRLLAVCSVDSILFSLLLIFFNCERVILSIDAIREITSLLYSSIVLTVCALRVLYSVSKSVMRRCILYITQIKITVETIYKYIISKYLILQR